MDFIIVCNDVSKSCHLWLLAPPRDIIADNNETEYRITLHHIGCDFGAHARELSNCPHFPS